MYTSTGKSMVLLNKKKIHGIKVMLCTSRDQLGAVFDELFRSMIHGLAHQHFCSYEEVKKLIDSWIASKDISFFRDGIRQLPKRWEKVVSSGDGQYFES